MHRIGIAIRGVRILFYNNKMAQRKGVSMQTYYHITEKGNVESIMQHGIIPKIGNGPENKAKRKEFFFSSREDMEDGLQNWLSDCFGENKELMCLEVSVPDSFLFRKALWNGKDICNHNPSMYISLLQEI